MISVLWQFGTWSKYKTKFDFKLFEKKKKIWVSNFPCCNTREELSIDVPITTIGLILTKLGWFFWVQTDLKTQGSYGQTDTVLESYGRHTKISIQSSKLRVSCRSLYASPMTGMHNWIPDSPEYMLNEDLGGGDDVHIRAQDQGVCNKRKS